MRSWVGCFAPSVVADGVSTARNAILGTDENQGQKKQTIQQQKKKR
jgi:hypothetical protein